MNYDAHLDRELNRYLSQTYADFQGDAVIYREVNLPCGNTEELEITVRFVGGKKDYTAKCYKIYRNGHVYARLAGDPVVLTEDERQTAIEIASGC